MCVSEATWGKLQQNLVRAPEYFTQFYKPTIIEQIGKKLRKGVYYLDNFVFLIENDKIINAFVAIDYIIKNPDRILKG